MVRRGKPSDPDSEKPDRDGRSPSRPTSRPDRVRTAIEWLNGHGGIDRCGAYALTSMGALFRVKQWPNRTGSAYSSTPPAAIHAVNPELVFGERVAGRTMASMRSKP